jgi:large subunit ribosomal protein L6
MLQSLIVGVLRGYRQKLRLVGIGFRAVVNKDKLILKIGYSHEVVYDIPSDVNIISSKAKGTLLFLKGKELYRVKQVASEIRSLRTPDSYKGKGICYDKEKLRLKKGKRENK